MWKKNRKYISGKKTFTNLCGKKAGNIFQEEKLFSVFFFVKNENAFLSFNVMKLFDKIKNLFQLK